MCKKPFFNFEVGYLGKREREKTWRARQDKTTDNEQLNIQDKTF